MDKLYLCWENFFQEHAIPREFASYYATVFADNQVSIANLAKLDKKFLEDLSIIEKEDKDLILGCLKEVTGNRNKGDSIVDDGTNQVTAAQSDVFYDNIHQSNFFQDNINQSDAFQVNVDQSNVNQENTSHGSYRKKQHESIIKGKSVSMENFHILKESPSSNIQSNLKNNCNESSSMNSEEEVNMRIRPALLNRMILLSIHYYRRMHQVSTRFQIHRFIATRFFVESETLLMNQLDIKLKELINTGELKLSIVEDAYIINKSKYKENNDNHECNENENVKTHTTLSVDQNLKAEIMYAITILNLPRARDIFDCMVKEHQKKQGYLNEIKMSFNESLLELLVNVNVKCFKKRDNFYGYIIYTKKVKTCAIKVTDKKNKNEVKLSEKIPFNNNHVIENNAIQIQSLIKNPELPIEIYLEQSEAPKFPRGINMDGVNRHHKENRKENINKKSKFVKKNTETKKLNHIPNKLPKPVVSLEDMIFAAIQNDYNLRRGSTKSYISKFISENYAVKKSNSFTFRFHTVLKKLVHANKIKCFKGVIDTFRINQCNDPYRNKAIQKSKPIESSETITNGLQSRNEPEVSTLLQEVSTLLPEVSTLLPEVSTLLPEVSTLLPDIRQPACPHFNKMVLTVIQKQSNWNKNCRRREIFKLLLKRYDIKYSKFNRKQSTLSLKELVQTKQVSKNKKGHYFTSDKSKFRKRKSTKASNKVSISNNEVNVTSEVSSKTTTSVITDKATRNNDHVSIDVAMTTIESTITTPCYPSMTNKDQISITTVIPNATMYNFE